MNKYHLKGARKIWVQPSEDLVKHSKTYELIWKIQTINQTRLIIIKYLCREKEYDQRLNVSSWIVMPVPKT